MKTALFVLSFIFSSNVFASNLSCADIFTNSIFLAGPELDVAIVNLERAFEYTGRHSKRQSKLVTAVRTLPMKNGKRLTEDEALDFIIDYFGPNLPTYLQNYNPYRIEAVVPAQGPRTGILRLGDLSWRSREFVPGRQDFLYPKHATVIFNDVILNLVRNSDTGLYFTPLAGPYNRYNFALDFTTGEIIAYGY